MQAEKKLRYAAVKAAKEALLERVKANPAEFMKKVQLAPHLLGGITDIGEIFDILLKADLFDSLMALADSRSLPASVRKILVSKLL